MIVTEDGIPVRTWSWLGSTVDACVIKEVNRL